MIDNLRESGWRIPLPNKYAKIKKDSLSHIAMSSKRKSKLVEADDGKKNCKYKIFKFTKITEIGRYSS